MKKLLAALLLFCMLLALCPAALAADRPLPEGTPVFEPGCVMELDFGTFTVLDAGFAKKAESIIRLGFRTSNGKKEEIRTAGYYSARDGFSLFAVKGTLKNTSQQDVIYHSISPTISYDIEQAQCLNVFPAYPINSEEYSRLAPGSEGSIILACEIPNALYFGSSDILLTIDKAALGFSKAELRNYESLGFEEGDSLLCRDVTQISGGAGTQAAAEGNPQAHIDELKIEGVRIKNKSRDLEVKVRNFYADTGDRHYPNSFAVSFQFLDADGDILSHQDISTDSMVWFSDLEYEQGGWSKMGGWLKPDGLANAAYIRFTGYVIAYNPGRTEWRIEGEFSDKIQYAIRDILE